MGCLSKCLVLDVFQCVIEAITSIAITITSTIRTTNIFCNLKPVFLYYFLRCILKLSSFSLIKHDLLRFIKHVRAFNCNLFLDKVFGWFFTPVFERSALQQSVDCFSLDEAFTVCVVLFHRDVLCYFV